ncbi:metal ABC transporter ATP-binding protein [Bdellovibrio sp. HCB209]|uniref:metal ABC transporter ATP-binding protein n=1 Tax=Bdellovibrio sp. HCB209 TaxID=3394354 RepID=UPI0039B3FB04
MKALSMKGVEVIYGNGHKALENINLELEVGNICALVGVNGAGKSTVFKALTGGIIPTHGKILLNGLEIREALRKNQVAYVPQSEDVDWNFPILVEDVVMMGRYGYMGFFRRPSKKDHEAVTHALHRVGLEDLRKRQIGELSGGQKKRVFVARALAQDSRIVLLDEPFTGVDVKTEASLMELFKTLAKDGRLILVSTHNLGSVPDFCTHAALLNKTIISAGPLHDSFTQENLAKTFGGMLRHLRLEGRDLHNDADSRTVTVITDDEGALVLYGNEATTTIIKKNRDDE